MPIKELFLDKRCEGLGNTFLESQPEEDVIDNSVLAAVRKRSRSWAHSKSRPDFFASSRPSDDNFQPERTSSSQADEQLTVTERAGQHIANAPVGANLSTNSKKIFPWKATGEPIFQPDCSHPKIQLPPIQPDTIHFEGSTLQCIVNMPQPSQREDLRSNESLMNGAFYDTGITMGMQNQPLQMPGFQTPSQESKQAGASNNVKEKFLEFVDQLKAASPKHLKPVEVLPAKCPSRAGPSSAGLSRAVPSNLPGVDSLIWQLRQQLAESSSPIPSGALPVGLVSSGMQKGISMPGDLKASADVITVTNAAHLPLGRQSPNSQTPSKNLSQASMERSNTPLHPPCFQDKASSLSRYTVLGNIEEWRLAQHPEIPEGCTMMIRNMPECVSIKAMLDQMELLGLGERVQCFYMPWIFSEANPMTNGYAFVNFDDAGAAEVLEQAWHDVHVVFPQQTRKPGKNCNKALNIGKAKVQGLRENLLKWSRSKTARIKNDFFKPLLFNGAMTFGI